MIGLEKIFIETLDNGRDMVIDYLKNIRVKSNNHLSKQRQ